MKNITLHKLLNSVGIIIPSEFINSEINNISFNSKDSKKGTLFLGRLGTKVDGGIYWQDAINNGAEAAIISKEAAKTFDDINLRRVLILENPLDYIFGQIISEFWNRPTRELKLIGITGTNGKTTIAFLLEYLLKDLGKKVALFGTLYNRWPNFKEVSTHTTDFADKLQPKLNEARKANVEFGIMEVSSHALAQSRISGCEFIATIFSNLSQDHLDYHPDMESYFETKKQLFKSPYLISKDSFAVINIDNDWGVKLFNNINALSLLISINNSERFLDYEDYFYITNKKITNKGSYFLFHTPSQEIEFFIPLVGEFNLMNALQAITVLYQLGFSLEAISNSIKSFPGVPGRMERVEIREKEFKKELPMVIVDYAHTPDGLEKVLDSISKFATGKIVTVFGCGGDRDSNKRSKMGSIAENLSDFIFITSDNPRTENPREIIDDILSGIKNKDKIFIEIDRYSAIKKAIQFAKIDDIVLIAGKGHEKYQILKNKTIEFDDKKVAYNFLINK
ncbi:MAG: UDP-N-acetylmuramoyl-L-alanyl-D-glutamate--2,6-diaminopimelate ligase [Prochlorococcus sp. SP3034]|nr:UDP-N-acetylmuramoyl-L-alanyl-D-glutamate--2,6-diaminopimelate ligase [Prochlorococcus sp. SP3034]|tara:strand:+ start:688 stop:2211 length:1524 start_codon:yes stop_codon:yes gene_type:complete